MKRAAKGGRPSGRFRSDTPRDSNLTFRNIAVAVLAGALPLKNPMTAPQIADLTGIPERTIRDAIAAGATFAGALGCSQ